MKGKVSLLKDKAFLGALLLCFVAAAVLIAANYYDIQQKKNDNYVDLNNVNQGGSQLAEASPENAEENTATQQDEMGNNETVVVLTLTEEAKDSLSVQSPGRTTTFISQCWPG